MASLEQARSIAHASGQLMFELAATRRLGELSGGVEGAKLVEQADAAMRDRGVARPERIARMLAPAVEVGTRLLSS